MPTVCPWIRRWNCSKSEEATNLIPENIKNQIQVVQGDITKQDCDCIVNAAIRSPLGSGAGAAGRVLHTAWLPCR